MGNCYCLNDVVKVNGKTYTIREKLGEGGFSTVHLVEDLKTHQLYALKKMICHSSEDLKTSLAEVECHKSISSEFIIKCIDYEEKGKKPNEITNSTSHVLLVLPYYGRGTLHDELMDRMKTKNHIKETVIIPFFRQICEGVQTLHSNNLAHRDLKTSNILLKDDWSPVIIDLGSVATCRVAVEGSKAARQLQDNAAERCTMSYKAPELFNVDMNCVIDERTDIWSLGCVLYAMCFFISPFDKVHERGDSVALAVIGGKIPFPENHNYSQDTINLISKMLKVEPIERPFIDEVIRNLDQIRNKLENIV